MNRRDALQKELDHLQEGVGRLFWECELPSDLSLHKARGTVYKLINIHHWFIWYHSFYKQTS